jgi:hypothetical protein
MKYVALLSAALLFSQCQKSVDGAHTASNVQRSVLVSEASQNRMLQDKPPEVEVSGEYAKAFLTAYDAFRQDADIPERKKQLEKYRLQFRQDSQAYFVSFVATPVPHVGGETDSGRDVTYAMSRRIIKSLPGSFINERLILRVIRLPDAPPNNGMQRTRNYHVSHARLVAGGRSCAPLMPDVGLLSLA